MPDLVPVFDGHNDLLLRLLKLPPEDRDAAWLAGDGSGHLDLPRMRVGGFVGGFFAVYIPSNSVGDVDRDEVMDSPPYALPLPTMVPDRDAKSIALTMVGILMRLERLCPDEFRICRTVAEIRDCIDRGTIAAILHMEGAEAISADLDALYTFHAMGLRSLGPVWSRPTIFGHGVPFRFPGDPDTGPGLTEAGERLVRACNELRILIDLSHLNEKGFDDVATISDAPLVATHSNAHAITRSTRNLTDRQLSMIRERRGIVGLNFATIFLREDGRRTPEMGWDPILRHLDHLIEWLGEDHVGFGSDFDGAEMPRTIGDVTGLPRLTDTLRAHGYNDALLAKLCHQNWLSVLGRCCA